MSGAIFIDDLERERLRVGLSAAALCRAAGISSGQYQRVKAKPFGKSQNVVERLSGALLELRRRRAADIVELASERRGIADRAEAVRG